MSSSHDKVADALARFSRWQCVLFSTACAERFAAIARMTACEATVSRVSSTLDNLWGFHDGDNGSAVFRLRQDIESSEEASADDSYTSEYYTMRSLSIIADAINAVDEVDANKAAISASSGAADLAADLDCLVTDVETVPTLRVTGKGILHTNELRYQMQDVEAIVLHSEAAAHVAGNLRSRSIQRSYSLSTSFTRICDKYGWTKRRFGQ